MTDSQRSAGGDLRDRGADGAVMVRTPCSYPPLGDVLPRDPTAEDGQYDPTSFPLVRPTINLDGDLDTILTSITHHPENILPIWTPQQLDGLLRRVEERWLFLGEPSDLHDFALDVLDLTDPWSANALKKQHASKMVQILHLYFRFIAATMIHSARFQAQRYSSRFSRIITLVTQMKDHLQGWSTISLITSPDYESAISNAAKVPGIKSLVVTDTSPLQNLVLFFLRKCSLNGYRRHREWVYEQIITDWEDRQYATRAWKPVCTLDAFPYRINKEENFDQWKNLTSGNNASLASAYLTQCNDHEFPELKMRRHRFSFQNGIYDASTLEWFPYESQEGIQDDDGCCKFHDLFFDDTLMDCENLVTGDPEPWLIPTPSFDSILEVQEIPDEARYWIYVLLGRMLFDIHELDDWEVILFFKGLAGTGKSSIGKTIKMFYNASDVAVLSPNMEKKFGLSAIYDKLMWLCYEVTGGWSLEQSDFQSMISGEEVTIAIKHKKAETSLTWKVPGIMMGNEMPPWLDTGNNIGRRIILIPFKKKVQNSDPGLLRKIEKEAPALLCKISICYHQAVSKHGRKDIWDVLPQWFIEQSKELKRDSSPLYAFIDEGPVKLGPNVYMPFKEFDRLFTEWAAEERIKRKPTRNQMLMFFEEMGLIKTGKTPRLWHNQQKTCEWLLGVNSTLADEVA